ncbi:hypothetical protein AB0K96_00005, partial [Streptomyces diastaticus]
MAAAPDSRTRSRTRTRGPGGPAASPGAPEARRTGPGPVSGRGPGRPAGVPGAGAAGPLVRAAGAGPAASPGSAVWPRSLAPLIPSRGPHAPVAGGAARAPRRARGPGSASYARAPTGRRPRTAVGPGRRTSGLGAGLTWREAMVLRAYAKYLRQAGATFSQ